MLQRWRAVGKTVLNLTGLRFEPITSRSKTNALPNNFSCKNPTENLSLDRVTKHFMEFCKTAMTLFNFHKKVDGAFKDLVFTNSKEKRSNDKFYSAATRYTRLRNTEKTHAKQIMHKICIICLACV